MSGGLCPDSVDVHCPELVQYRVAYEADGRRLKEVDEPRLFATGHASPQPFLSPLEETARHLAHRLAPYRPRRERAPERDQQRLPAMEDESPIGGE